MCLNLLSKTYQSINNMQSWKDTQEVKREKREEKKRGKKNQP